MTQDIVAKKKEIRKAMREKRVALTNGDQDAAALKVRDRLFELPAIQSASTVAGYMSMPGELDLSPFLSLWLVRGKDLCLPRVNGSILWWYQIPRLAECIPGYQGIKEPDPAQHALIRPEAVDVLLIPALAFDTHGNRLGQGGGFYDRMLAHLDPQPTTIGIAHSFQVLPDLPFESGKDMPVDWVVTPDFTYNAAVERVSE